MNRADERAARYAADLERAWQRGPLFAHHWVIAQRLISDGCPPPPSGREYVAPARAAASGSKVGELDAAERTSLAAFWAWYLRAEAHVLRLVEALEFCQREEHSSGEFGAHLLAHAHALQSELDRWLLFGHWLPARPPLARTLQHVLRDAIVRYG